MIIRWHVTAFSAGGWMLVAASSLGVAGPGGLPIRPTGNLEIVSGPTERIPELFDDWAGVVEHLDRMEWAHNPVPFARAGLFERAGDIIAGGYSWGPDRQVARGLEAAAAGRFSEATNELQQAVDMLRDRPTDAFYVASLALADVWAAAGSGAQVIRVLEETVATAPAYGMTG